MSSRKTAKIIGQYVMRAWSAGTWAYHWIRCNTNAAIADMRKKKAGELPLMDGGNRSR